MLGLRDIKTYKVFVGQVLGLEFDLPTRSWFAPVRKLEDLSQSLDEIVDKTDPARPVAFTVNSFERCLGILDSFANNSAIAKSLLLVPKAEMSFYLKRFHDQNLIRPEKQTEYCTLSAYARNNILAVRALLVISPEYHLPLEDIRRPAATGSAAVTDLLYTDTSGLPKLAQDQNYTGTCLGAYLPATIDKPTARAWAFVLPFSFLISRIANDGVSDQKYVCDDTTFLELLPPLAVLLHSPLEFKNRSIMVCVDNQTSVHLFQKCKAKARYTAFALEVLRFTLRALNCDMKLVWRRRRSSYPMIVADDLTHHDFRSVERGNTECQILSLPPPLFEVIHGTSDFKTHRFDELREITRTYLSQVVPDIIFPW